MKWIVPCLFLLAVSCAPERDAIESAEAEPPEPAVAEPEARTSPSNGDLRRAVGVTFGLPLPRGLVLLERDSDVARFETEHSADALIEFYSRVLEGYEVEPGGDGAMFESSDGEGADIFVLEAEGNMRHVLYFRADVDAEFAALFEAVEEREPVDPATLPFTQRYPWPGGLRDNRRVIVPTATPSDSLLDFSNSSYYDETVQEIDGEERHVLTVIPRDTEGNGGSEGNSAGQRLRSRNGVERYRRPSRRRPNRSANGEPLPFNGPPHRIELPPGTVH
jgi:hypothetical protein